LGRVGTRVTHARDEVIEIAHTLIRHCPDSVMSPPTNRQSKLWTTAMPSKKRMSHADECVRLAGLTDDLIVRDQLLDFAQEWLLAARRARRPSDDTRVVSLHKNLGDNVVPLHTNQDDDDS
jgi:hypothetical protein